MRFLFDISIFDVSLVARDHVGKAGECWDKQMWDINGGTVGCLWDWQRNPLIVEGPSISTIIRELSEPT